MTWMRTAGLLGGLAAGGLLVYLYSAFGAFLPWRERQEAERLAEVLGVREGASIAEIGAGGGRFTETMARRVGPSGRVYSTEIDEESLEAIRKRMDAAGLRNVTIVEAGEAVTNLPDGCCEAVFLRNVYHHLRDPEAFAASLRRAVKPGGRLAIIDFEPASMPFHGGRPDGASERRDGHGVSRAHAAREMSAAGFTLEREVPEWAGPLWLMVFRAAAQRLD